MPRQKQPTPRQNLRGFDNDGQRRTVPGPWNYDEANRNTIGERFYSWIADRRANRGHARRQRRQGVNRDSSLTWARAQRGAVQGFRRDQGRLADMSTPYGGNHGFSFVHYPDEEKEEGLLQETKEPVEPGDAVRSRTTAFRSYDDPEGPLQYITSRNLMPRYRTYPVVRSLANAGADQISANVGRYGWPTNIRELDMAQRRRLARLDLLSDTGTSARLALSNAFLGPTGAAFDDDQEANPDDGAEEDDFWVGEGEGNDMYESHSDEYQGPFGAWDHPLGGEPTEAWASHPAYLDDDAMSAGDEEYDSEETEMEDGEPPHPPYSYYTPYDHPEPPRPRTPPTRGLM